jgi:hypothetical protein
MQKHALTRPFPKSGWFTSFGEHCIFFSSTTSQKHRFGEKLMGFISNSILLSSYLSLSLLSVSLKPLSPPSQLHI